MHPDEFWWLAEVKRPRKMFGRLNEDEVAELWEELHDDGYV